MSAVRRLPPQRQIGSRHDGDQTEPAWALEEFEVWLARQPLAERFAREYLRNVRAFCAWLATTPDRDGWSADPLTDPIARDHAVRDFRRFLQRFVAFIGECSESGGDAGSSSDDVSATREQFEKSLTRSIGSKLTPAQRDCVTKELRTTIEDDEILASAGDQKVRQSLGQRGREAVMKCLAGADGKGRAGGSAG